jgi:hypothetical protein
MKTQTPQRPAWCRIKTTLFNIQKPQRAKNMRRLIWRININILIFLIISMLTKRLHRTLH